MPQNKKAEWSPATEFKVVRLRPNGPKPGQSLRGWLYGKQMEQRDFDALKARKLQRGEL
jgi:hypothetical protein